MLVKKLSLPPQELRFMNEGDEKFLKIGRENLNILREYGFNASHYILDIGCGYGRLAYAIINNINFQGKYIGVDILPKHLSWCTNHITFHYPNIYTVVVIDS